MGLEQSSKDGDRSAFLEWARSNSTPVSGRAIDALVGRARVVTLGEEAHGMEEVLVFRNQLLQILVTSKGFSGIALETGYAESLRIEAFIAGGPGTAVDVARTSFTSGFGNFQANADLIAWMREYNRTAPAVRQLRFFGIDLSLGGPTGS